MAELTGMLDLSSWPAGMRVIVRKEGPIRGAVAVHRPRRTATDRIRHQHHHPGNWRPWNYVTVARARCEDASVPPRTADCVTCRCTGSTRTASGASSSNWPAVAGLDPDLALTDSPARRWEPKALRLRLFSQSQHRLTCHARRRRLKLATGAPHLHLLLDGIRTLTALPTPADTSTDRDH